MHSKRVQRGKPRPKASTINPKLSAQTMDEVIRKENSWVAVIGYCQGSTSKAKLVERECPHPSFPLLHDLH